MGGRNFSGRINHVRNWADGDITISILLAKSQDGTRPGVGELESKEEHRNTSYDATLGQDDNGWSHLNTAIPFKTLLTQSVT
jgi:hypothetical protein